MQRERVASGKLATKAAGAAVWFGRDFEADHGRRIATPPAELNGRGLDLRVKTPKGDFLAMVQYYPPKVTQPKDFTKYRATVKQLTTWASGILKVVPSRRTPTLYANVNHDTEEHSVDLDGRLPCRPQHGRCR